MTAFLVCLGATIAIYGRAWRGPWQFDDPAITDTEPQFRKGFNWSGRRGLRQFVCAGRTLNTMVFAWTYAVAGFRIEVWRGINFLMHAANTWLLYCIVQYAAGSAIAAGSAAVFLVHPIQAFSACYVSARPGMQVLFFTLCGVLLFLNGHWILAILSQFLAWRSKEDGLIYAVLYPIFWFWSR